jgi:hypothetical protein
VREEPLPERLRERRALRSGVERAAHRGSTTHPALPPS